MGVFQRIEIGIVMLVSSFVVWRLRKMTSEQISVVRYALSMEARRVAM